MFVNIYVYILVNVTPADEALNVPRRISLDPLLTMMLLVH